MSTEKRVLRACTYNIHKGFCAMNLRFILDQLREAIRSVDADLIFLQEVVGERVNAPPVVNGECTSQFEFLADEVWHHHAYGKNAVYQKGHHGNAVLSKWPLLHWDNHDVSHWWFSRRGILLGQLDNGVYVACVHFGLLLRERRRQLRQLQRIIRDKIPAQAPLMIAGDFNDWTLELDHHLRAIGFSEALSQNLGKPARTYPAKFPLFRMDRMYFRNMELQEAKVLNGGAWQKLSDHRALYASFAL